MLTFSPGSFHIKPRDKSIGWSARQCARRLKFVLNNSRVLALTLRRLSDDWIEHHGNSVLMVETFVDESRYRGTCYRAWGFVSIGPTGGFSRNARDFYVEHGRPSSSTCARFISRDAACCVGHACRKVFGSTKELRRVRVPCGLRH